MATTAADHISGATHEANTYAEAALRRKASQLQKFFDDVEELLGQVPSMDGSEVARLRNRVEASFDHAKSVARDGVHAAVDGTRSAALATDEYVHRKPWIAIGATAVTCLALGALLRSR
jgi:ElaB/YqjD/DUF883 family membrane-anchored ribosome-binding protein